MKTLLNVSCVFHFRMKIVSRIQYMLSIPVLVSHKANVNQTDDEGRTALIAASYMGHSDIVEHLLDNGAEINHEDADGRTALSVAALCVPNNEGYAKVVNILLERAAFVDHQDKDGMTPLLVAAFEGHR